MLTTPPAAETRHPQDEPGIAGLWLRLARNSTWTLIGAAASQLLSLVATVIVARILGSAVYGTLGVVQSTIGFFAVFTGMSLGLTATKYIAPLRQTDPARTGAVISLTVISAAVAGLVLTLFLFAAAPVMATSFLSSPGLTNALRIASPLLLLYSVNGAQLGILAGFEAFRSIAATNIVRGLCTVPVSALLALRFGLEGAVWALVLTALVHCMTAHRALSSLRSRLNLRMSPRRAWSERAILWDFSLPVFLSPIIYGAVTWILNLLLISAPAGYSELGVFTAANQWRMAIMFLPALLVQPLLPMFSRLSHNRQHEDFRRLLSGSVILTLAATASIAAVIVFCSPWIAGAYGKDFRGMAPVLAVLALATVASGSVPILTQAMVSRGQTWESFRVNLVWGVVAVALSWMFVRRHGAMGIAAGILLSHVAQAALIGIRYVPELLRTHRPEVPLGPLAYAHVPSLEGDRVVADMVRTDAAV